MIHTPWVLEYIMRRGMKLWAHAIRILVHRTTQSHIQSVISIFVQCFVCCHHFTALKMIHGCFGFFPSKEENLEERYMGSLHRSDVCPLSSLNKIAFVQCRNDNRRRVRETLVLKIEPSWHPLSNVASSAATFWAVVVVFVRGVILAIVSARGDLYMCNEPHISYLL